MDVLYVFRPVVDFFIRYCSVVVTVGGFSFTVGSMFIWCGVVVIVWSFIRRLAD